MVKLSDLAAALNAIAPLELAEEWDNVGLLAGDLDHEVRKVLLTIDLTRGVLDEAAAGKADLILAYHPPIFEPLKAVVKGRGVSPLLYEVIRNGMGVYAVHTALDVVAGGVNDRLAEAVEIANPQPLQAQGFANDQLCKIVVFLPELDLEKVSAAIFAAGAGHIGNYSHCSFRVEGVGTFKGDESTNPTVGQAGRFEQAAELRLETIVPTERLAEVMRAMIDAHSYEEVAYDVYPVLRQRNGLGLGRFGDLPRAVKKTELIETIKKKLKVKTVGVIGATAGTAKRIAVCAGSCGSILKQVIRNQCDFYLTGELSHHNALKLQEAGVTTVCVSHSNSERLILQHLVKQLQPQCPDVEFSISKKDKDPFVWQ